MLSLLQSVKPLRSYSRTTINRAQEGKRAVRVNHVRKGQKTEPRVRVYAHSPRGNRGWAVYLGSVSFISFNKLDSWLYSGRGTSAAPVWVHVRNCTAKHDWLGIVCTDQHRSTPPGRFRMVEWADTIILSGLRCRNAYGTIHLFLNLTLLYPLAQVRRGLQHPQRLLTFAMWFSTAMFLNFSDRTCLPLMVKRYGKNSWILWMREIEKIISDWMSSCPATNRQLTTLIAWMSCERVCMYSHEALKIVKKLFMH